MRRFTKKSGIERRLRAERPKAPSALVESIVRNVAVEPRRAPRSARACYAAAVAVLILGAFASFGGIGYAASATTQTVKTVKQIATGHHVTVRHSSAGTQYKKPKSNVGKAPTQKPKTVVLAATASSPQGTLPFTGISLGVTLAISLLLVGLGVALRRRDAKS
jgi:hypothetical protein